MSYVQVALQQGGINDLQELFAAFNRRCAFHERRCCRGVGVIQLLHKVAAFLWGDKQCWLFVFYHSHLLKRLSSSYCPSYTDLCEVINESEMSLLQLCPRQRRQRVRIVQLLAVLRWKQVWIQPNNMCWIYIAQKGKSVISPCFRIQTCIISTAYLATGPGSRACLSIEKSSFWNKFSHVLVHSVE